MTNFGRVIGPRSPIQNPWANRLDYLVKNYEDCDKRKKEL